MDVERSMVICSSIWRAFNSAGALPQAILHLSSLHLSQAF